VFIDLRCRVFSDETGVFTEIPAIYTPAGWLMPLVWASPSSRPRWTMR
jgi:hypothetical protein